MSDPVRQTRFFWKLCLSYAILIVTNTFVANWIASARIEKESLAEIEQTLISKTALLRELANSFLVRGSTEALKTSLGDLSQRIDARLTVVLADGTVAGDSSDSQRPLENHLDRPEIVAAREQGLGRSTRYSHTMKGDQMYVALPIRRGEKLLGYARTSLPLTMVGRRVDQARHSIALSTPIAVGIALILGFLFARQINRPLASVTEAALKIADGDYQTKVRIDTNDEIGLLTRAFNSMSDELAKRMQIISRDRNEVVAILRSLVEGVIAVDAHEHLTHLNPAAGKMLGVTPGSGLGRPIREISRIPEIADMVQRVLSEGKDQRRDVRWSEMGQDATLYIRGTPLRDAHESLLGAVVILHDVTDLRHLEEVRRDFVANVSHELKTPVTAIRGLAETLIEDREMDLEKQTSYLMKIRAQTLRLGSLVADLLTLARIESKETAFQLVDLDIRTPVHDSAKSFMSVALEKPVSLSVSVPTDSVVVSVDEEGLRQVVDNLLDNAIKYSSPGGRIRVRVSRQDDRAVIAGEDCGIGIEACHLNRLFERFYRVDKGRSREMGGTGLGLSIVKHTVVAFNGEVKVKSTPGKGSTFSVHLPLSNVRSGLTPT